LTTGIGPICLTGRLCCATSQDAAPVARLLTGYLRRMQAEAGRLGAMSPPCRAALAEPGKSGSVTGPPALGIRCLGRDPSGDVQRHRSPQTSQSSARRACRRPRRQFPPLP